jgi:hypothetical protein
LHYDNFIYIKKIHYVSEKLKNNLSAKSNLPD